jgi:hypothetical protein
MVFPLLQQAYGIIIQSVKFYFLEGKGTRFIGDSIDAINSGEIILMGSNLPHAFARDIEFYERNKHLTPQVVLIQFDKDFLCADI